MGSQAYSFWKGHVVFPNHFQIQKGQEGIQNSQLGFARCK